MHIVLSGHLDVTDHTWCLGIITEPIPEGEMPLQAPLVDECGWGPVGPKEAPDDGESAYMGAE